MNPTRTSASPHEASRSSLQRGFTVIELMAVLTILAILATAVTASTMSRMRRTARETEVANLANISDALRSYIKLTRMVPVASNWPALVASQMAVSSDRVTKTSAGYPRFFALDPSAQLGATAGASLPFTQTASGALEPQNARIVIVSSLSKPLPAFTMTASNFASIWNCPEGALPIVFTNYFAAADEFKIQRLDLRELFYRVVLSNLDPINTPSYSIDTVTNGASVNNGTYVERWYIANTPVNLHYGDGSMQARDILRNDISYVFETGRWSRYLCYGKRPPLTTFANIVEQFRSAPSSSTATANGVTTQDVVNELLVWMNSYATWSGSGNPFAPGTDDLLSPQLQALRDSQARLDAYTKALIPAF